MTKVIQLLFISLLLLGCSEKQDMSSPASTGKKYSRFLSIRDEKNGVYIDIKHPDRKNKSYKFFIKKEPNSTIPAEYVEIRKGNLSFLVFSTTHCAMLAQLNQIQKIKGTCSRDLIYNPEIKQKIDTKKIVDFGNETNPSIEKIIALKPSVIVYSGFSAEFAKNKELQKLGIITIPNFDWKESHPLGKAEWILLFGYLTGSEDSAKEHLAKITKEYNELKKSIQGDKKRPVVLSGSKMGDFWYAPAGESYMSQLISDAGGTYLYKNTKGTGSLSYGQEKILIDAKKANFWINPGLPSYRLLKLSNPKASFLKPFQEKNVFCYTKNPNKYWELSAVHPEWVLSDLISIFHSFPSKKLHFYQPLD